MGQIGVLPGALAFGLVVDLHDLVAAGPIVELDPVDGEAVHVQRTLIGEGAANHENEAAGVIGTSVNRGIGTMTRPAAARQTSSPGKPFIYW